MMRLAQQRFPVGTSALTGFAVMGVGDAAVQLGADGMVDAQRVLISSSYNGFVYSPFMHLWWGKLDVWFPGRSAAAVASKVLINQAAITPFNSLFYMSWSKVVGALARDGHEADWRAVRAQTEAHLRTELPSLLAMSCAFWPVVHSFNFAFAPLSLRIVFMSCCSVCWGAYLSYVTHRQQPHGDGHHVRT